MNAEICKKCPYYWRIDIVKNKPIEYIYCVCLNKDKDLPISGKNMSCINELKICNKMRKKTNWNFDNFFIIDYEMDEDCCYEIFILKPIIINKSLKNNFKKIVVNKDYMCPYFIEHQLSEWNYGN